MTDPWRQHLSELRRFVGKRVSNPHEVEDIVQDVLTRAHEALHQLESVERRLAWLARIAARRIVDHYRARRPMEELPEDLAAAEAEDSPVERLAPCLPAMIERLPEIYRDAVRMSELDGMPQQEVAHRLGISLSGAKSRVQRGRALLRSLVEACCQVGEVVEQVLQPFAALPQVAQVLHLGVHVEAISREGFDKVKTVGREAAAFVIRGRRDGQPMEWRARWSCGQTPPACCCFWPESVCSRQPCSHGRCAGEPGCMPQRLSKPPRPPESSRGPASHCPMLTYPT